MLLTADLHAYVLEQQATWQVPALVVGIRDGDSQEVRGFGVADDARFRIASLTKPFTAMLAAGLAAEGRLDLETPFLSGGIALAHLLSHSGGLGSELPGGLERFGAGDDALEAAVGEHRDVPRHATPGELWAYCNFGYWLAGAECARADRSPYEDALRVRVLEPLGLADTGFELEPSVEGHDPYAELPRIYPRARRPSGGLVSAAADLLRFAAFHLAEGPVAAAMREPRIGALGSDWGLGWELRGRVVGHGGSWGGFRSRLALVPDRGLAVVVLANSAAAGVAVERIAARALVQHGVVATEEPLPIALPDAQLAAYAGRYRAVEREYRVVAEGGALRVESAGEPSVVGRPISEREFVVLEGEEAGWRFDFPRPCLARFSVFAGRVD